ncbi:MAG TPA: BTAD domain-containing putative transcriptional regulator [Mycobacteriales bacterium]|nr:BTAD domain-containing putative transcriptional regulator [Mycobacteriales bacterium]
MGEDPGLRVRLLGGLDIEGVDLGRLGSRKARVFIQRLAIARGRPVGVDTLVDVLWPEGDAPARPAAQLSVLASRCRAALGIDSVSRSDAGYALSMGWLDVSAAEALADEAEIRLAEGGRAAASAAADAALRLIRGPLLPDDPDAEWLAADRAAVERLRSRILLLSAESAAAAGRHRDAVEAARRALDHDRYDEGALRVLMRASAASGRAAAGLAAYAELAERLADDLGVDPHPDTQAVHLSLLHAGDPTSASASCPAAVTLAGRQVELDRLQAGFDDACAGNSRILAIEGEAGIGKTRLLDALLSAVGPRCDVLRTVASGAGALPFAPVLDVLSRRLRGAPASERGELLGADAEVVAPLLGLGSGSVRDVLVSREPGANVPDLLQLALLNVMTRLASIAPVVLAIDDAHHADAATLDWLEVVAQRAAGLPLLVVLAYRSGAGRVPEAATVLRLERLDRAAAVTLLGDDVPAERVDALLERSGGNPLFLVELAQSTEAELPDSIRQAVLARLAGDEEAASTLRAAAALGPVVDVDVLSSLLRRPVPDLLDDLELGMRRHVLEDARTGFVFRHDLLRDALAADLPSARRAWLHREAARVLNDRPGSDPLVVADHARLGGDLQVAARALRTAAGLAAERYDHVDALRLVDESLALDDCADGHIDRSRQLLFLGRYDDARDEASLALGKDSDDGALQVATYAAYYGRDWPATLALANQAAARTADPEVRLTCQFLAAKALHTTGRLVECEQRLRAAADAAPASPLRPFVVIWTGFLHLHRGDVEHAEACLAEETAARRAPFPFSGVYADQITAHAQVLFGRPLHALAITERMAAAVQDQHADRFTGRAEVYRGWVLSLLGAPEAGDALAAARELASSAGAREPYGQGTLDLAALLLRADRLDEAAALLDEVGALLEGGPISNGWRIDLRRRYISGCLALAAGDLGSATATAGEVHQRATAEGMHRHAALADALRTRVRLLSGSDVPADGLASLAHTLHNVARPEAWLLTARLAAAARNDRLAALARSWADDWRRAAGGYAESFARLADREFG